MIQVDLSFPLSRVPGATANLTTWVENQPGLRRGNTVTLKEFGDQNWKIEKVYDVEVPKDQLDANRNWDNNDYSKHDGTPMKGRK